MPRSTPRWRWRTSRRRPAIASGCVAYGRRVHARIAPDRGARHLRRLLEVLAQARAEAVEGDHAAAAAALLRTQQQRSLIVWLTDLAETAGVPDVIECASQMADRHLVLCAMLRQMDVAALAEASPSTPADLYRVLAAQEVLDRRETLLRGLRRRGALALDLAPGDVASAVVQRYLAIKERNASVVGLGRLDAGREAEIHRQQHEHRRADRELGQRIEAGGGDEALDQARR